MRIGPFVGVSSAAERVLAHSSLRHRVCRSKARRNRKNGDDETQRSDAHATGTGSPLGALDAGRLSNDRARFKFSAHELRRARTRDNANVARRIYFSATRVSP